MDKKTITLTIVATGLLIFVICTSIFNKKDIIEENKVTLPNDKEVSLGSEVITNEETINDEKIKDIFTEEEIENTKQIAMEFAMAINSVDGENISLYSNEAIKFTVDSLKDRIVESSKIIDDKKYTRVITAGEQGGRSVDEKNKSIIWNVILKALTYDKAGEQTGTERINMKIVIVKDKGDFKVGEYSIDRTENKFY